MSLNRGLLRNVSGCVLLLAVLLITFGSMIPLTKSLAASGTWNMDVDGTWEDNTSGVWLNNIVPEGAGSAANFDFDITADHTVTMNSNHTIGTLFFRDKTTSSNNWTLANGNSAVLTLDNNASSPVISVSNRSATISAPLAGTHGVTLTGGGNANLYLSGNNTYSGGTTINSTGGGNLFSVYTGSNTAFGAGDVHFNPGGSNAARMFIGGGLTINNDIYLDTVRAIAGNNGGIMIGNFSTSGTTVTVDRNV